MNLEDYKFLTDEYENLQDNQPEVAYSIMVRASSVLAFLESEEVKKEQFLNNYKTLAEALENQIAVDCMAEGDSAAKAEKIARADSRRIQAWNTYYGCKKEHGELSALIRYLLRIYYDTKSNWESGRKVYRSGRDNQ